MKLLIHKSIVKITFVWGFLHTTGRHIKCVAFKFKRVTIDGIEIVLNVKNQSLAMP